MATKKTTKQPTPQAATFFGEPLRPLGGTFATNDPGGSEIKWCALTPPRLTAGEGWRATLVVAYRPALTCYHPTDPHAALRELERRTVALARELLELAGEEE